MGETGPCGPCSEIHYDLGPQASDFGHTDCQFPCDCGRYFELWNLVFMQFNRDEQGKLTPLPRPSIDTGAGLERLATVLQGKISNFDTDLFRPLIDSVTDLANVEYGASREVDVSLRIVADHSRAATFLISDGVLPSNEGRGYVLRLILRRALYHAQTLGLSEPFMFTLAGQVIEMMKGAYSELLESAPHVARAIKVEEERYAQTTSVGLEKLDGTPVITYAAVSVPLREWKQLFTAGQERLVDHISAVAKATPVFDDTRISLARRFRDRGLQGGIPGDALFKLHDTFGLRPDFVEDILRNYGLGVDREGYEAELQGQR
jgi:alanyl-tRNA synthetase